MYTDQQKKTFINVGQLRLSFFLFVGLHHPSHLIVKNQKSNHKSQKMLAGCDRNCSICCIYKTVIILKYLKLN